MRPRVSLRGGSPDAPVSGTHAEAVSQRQQDGAAPHDAASGVPGACLPSSHKDAALARAGRAGRPEGLIPRTPPPLVNLHPARHTCRGECGSPALTIRTPPVRWSAPVGTVGNSSSSFLGCHGGSGEQAQKILSLQVGGVRQGRRFPPEPQEGTWAFLPGDPDVGFKSCHQRDFQSGVYSSLQDDTCGTLSGFKVAKSERGRDGWHHIRGWGSRRCPVEKRSLLVPVNISPPALSQ